MMRAKTTKPSKARKRLYSAPHHLRGRQLSAPLSPTLRAEHGVRSMPIVEDDTVTIVKGDRRLAEGRVLRVDRKHYRIYVEGITRTRMDGSTVQVPIKPQNVMITRLNLRDPWRRGVLERKGFQEEE